MVLILRSVAGIQSNRRRGFTAIELAAVASIIAILALILLPIVRKRVDQARITATLDDLRTIEIGQTLANADTGFYYRLSDLDNGTPDQQLYTAGGTPQDAVEARKIPNGLWNQVFTIQEQTTATNRGKLLTLWQGPYIPYNKTKFQTLQNLASDLFRFRVVNIDNTPPTTTSGSGPIPIFQSGSTAADPFNDDVTNGEIHPIDPWGSPYIFFGPGSMGTLAGATELSNTGVVESNWGTAAAYSTGPDALPGNLQNYTAIHFFRETGVLGTQDDLVRVF